MGKYEILMGEVALSEERISSFKVECNSYKGVCLRISVDDFHKRVLQHNTCFDNLVKQVGLRSDRLVQQRNTLMKSISQIQTYVLSDKSHRQLQLGQLGQSKQKFFLKKNDGIHKAPETQRKGSEYMTSKTPISLSPRVDFVKNCKQIITLQMNSPSQEQAKQRERVLMHSFQKKMDQQKAYMTNIINTKRHVKPQNYLYEWRQQQKSQRKSQQLISLQQPQENTYQQPLPSINVISSLNNIQVMSDNEEDKVFQDQDSIKEIHSQTLVQEQSNQNHYQTPQSAQLIQPIESSRQKNYKLQRLTIDVDLTASLPQNSSNSKLLTPLTLSQQLPSHSQNIYQQTLSDFKGKSNSISTLFTAVPLQNQKRKSLNIFQQKFAQEDNSSNIQSPPTSSENLGGSSASTQNLHQNKLESNNSNYNSSHNFRSTSHISIPTQSNIFEFSRKKRSSFYGVKLMSPSQSTTNKISPVREIKQFVEFDRKSLQDIFSDDTGKSVANTHRMNNHITQPPQQGMVQSYRNLYELNQPSNANFNLKSNFKDSPLKTNIYLQGNKLKSPAKMNNFLMHIATAAQ